MTAAQRDLRVTARSTFGDEAAKSRPRTLRLHDRAALESLHNRLNPTPAQRHALDERW